MIPDWARPHIAEALAGGAVLAAVVLGAWAVL